MAASIDRPVAGSQNERGAPSLTAHSFPHRQANREVRANLDTILELKVDRLAIFAHRSAARYKSGPFTTDQDAGFHTCVGDIIERPKPKALSSQSTQLHRLWL
jgi:hypothetical protein